jgi:hypothetical protein
MLRTRCISGRRTEDSVSGDCWRNGGSDVGESTTPGAGARRPRQLCEHVLMRTARNVCHGARRRRYVYHEISRRCGISCALARRTRGVEHHQQLMPKLQHVHAVVVRHRCARRIDASWSMASALPNVLSLKPRCSDRRILIVISRGTDDACTASTVSEARAAVAGCVLRSPRDANLGRDRQRTGRAHGGRAGLDRRILDSCMTAMPLLLTREAGWLTTRSRSC